MSAEIELAEITLPDIFHRHFPAGPTFKSLSALMEQHVHTVYAIPVRQLFCLIRMRPDAKPVRSCADMKFI